jgi:hypothetical protein
MAFPPGGACFCMFFIAPGAAKASALAPGLMAIRYALFSCYEMVISREKMRYRQIFRQNNKIIPIPCDGRFQRFSPQWR